MDKLAGIVEEFHQASASLKDAMRLVRSVVLCMLTAVTVLLWWELVIHGLLLRSAILTAALAGAFLVAVHDDPRYDTAMAMLGRTVGSILRRWRAHDWPQAGATQPDGAMTAAAEGFGVTASGALVVQHRIVTELTTRVVGVPVVAVQPYVHRVFLRDSRGHILELMRLFIYSTWRVRDLTRLYCEPDKDTTICDPVATQRGLGVSVYFVTASMNGDCHIHELRHKSFRDWRHVVLTRGKSRKWLVSPRTPKLTYNRGLRYVNASNVRCRAVPHEGILSGRTWDFETL